MKLVLTDGVVPVWIRCTLAGRTSRKDDDMSRFVTDADTDKVVSMGRFRNGKSLSPIRQAEAYWCALGEGTAVPRRSQIDPRGLENILEFTFVLERIAPRIARFRLAGHHLNDLAGMEVRGMPLTAFFTLSARPQIAAALEHMFDAPAVAELSMQSETKPRRTPLEAKMILLPLEDDLGVINRALGVLIADIPAGHPVDHTPIRFDLRTNNLHHVNGPQIERTSERMFAPAAEKTLVMEFGEDQAPISRPATHLRVVK